MTESKPKIEVLVTTEHGVFRGRTRKAAMKLAAAASEKAEADESQKRLNYEHAVQLAESRAFRILRRVHAGEKCASGWTFFAVDDEWCATYYKPELDAGQGHLKLGRDGSGLGVTIHYNASEFRGVLIDSGGEPLGYLIKTADKERFWAVGVCEDQWFDTLVDDVTEAWLYPK